MCSIVFLKQTLAFEQRLRLIDVTMHRSKHIRRTKPNKLRYCIYICIVSFTNRNGTKRITPAFEMYMYVCRTQFRILPNPIDPISRVSNYP